MFMKHDDSLRPQASVPAGERWEENTQTTQRPIKNVCVYCGSASKVDDRFKAHAAELGKLIAEKGMELIYGGGRVGLMGIAADAALNAGGKVIGIIPAHIQEMEVEHHGLTELHVVDSMHTRKRMMAERADAYVVLPGGFGTLDEAFEIITWKRLQLHNKPIILLDDNGFWQPLLKLFEHLIETGFALPRDRALYKVATSLEEVMQLLHKPQSDAPVQSGLM
jgi:uncharacterized protein (TIGR00730 family)